MKRLLLFAALCCGFVSYSQLLTWTPAFPKETDAITITVDATKGNQGLLGFSGNVYVHIGAITNLSSGPSNWLHSPFTWGSSEAAAQATPAGTNKWSFTISNPRTFFGLAAGEELKYIAILFRQSNCPTSGCLAQRNADGSDMYVPIYTASLAVRLNQPPREPKYIPTPEPQTWIVGTNFTISADANKPSAMKLYHNGSVIASASNVTSLPGNSSVTVLGNQQIVAEANDGSTTKYDTMNVFVSPPSSPVAPLPSGVQDGINYISSSSVTLVLRAPGKNVATVIGEFNNWIPTVMNKTPDGKFFWVTITGLTATTEYAYQYVVDNTIKIADPYAEKVLDPSNDGFISATTYPGLKAYPAGQSGIVSVFQITQPAYTWGVSNYNRPDKRGLVIYELLLRDFVAAHDWKTLKDTLSYLKRLGINAIELMPFNEFGGNSSWGYNPYQYFALDKYYGPKNRLKEFIDTCHKNGIAVIMDIVLNHTYGESPLAKLYWDAANNRPAANNPWYNPVAPHAFGFGDDFNHASDDTKYFFNRVLQHWVNEYRIDGYRFDFSKGLTQKSSSNDGAFSAYDASRIAIINQYAATIRAVDANSYLILEHFCDNTEEKEFSDNGMLIWGNLNFSYGEAAKGVTGNSDFSWGIYSVRGYTNPHVVTYMESHDEERIVWKALNEGSSGSGYNIRDTATALKRMELDAAFLLTIPGPKMIWQFGELGYHYSINTCTNLTVNNNCRLDEKPIRWDFQNDTRRKNVFDVYSKLIKLRFHPWYKGAFQTGAVDRSLNSAFKWIKLTTTGDTSDLMVIGNFDVNPQTGTVTFPTAGNWYDYFGNFIHTATGAAQSFTLQPGEFHIYTNRNVNNLTTTPVNNIPWNGNTLEAKIYPNPVINSSYSLEIKMPQSGKTNIELYNNVGQYISTVYNGFLTNGTRVFTLPSLQTSKGIYFLKIISKDKTKTIALTLQ